ncbi:Chalcone-flavanone isomerase family protein [Parasponia andersonii]|uniref:Chalcone-flavanone isomerase family protein n=1 Tax=Parasponia andersonii TaxID=3476 RepID=A0A2P5B1J8_PARAD|nr:Chalcone-flavanone isomerase family protein [Parasponia andersonii]
METPSSTRRVTRSQTLAAQNNNIPISRKTEDFEKGLSNSRQRKGKQQDRSVLLDITNDSPIVGLAVGALETPLSSIVKQRSSRVKNTPGSGEALLRGQVKTLLQKVEEEAELSKLSLQSRPFVHLKGLVNSPAGLLAPTPANTPQVSNLSCDEVGMINSNNLYSEAPTPFVEEQLIFQVVDEKEEASLELQKSIITRSLLLDFSEKSDSCDSSECSSAVTYQGAGGETECKEKPTPDDDNASIWSVQVNASTLGDEDEDEVFEEEEGEDDYYLEEGDKDGGEEENDLVDELCDCISKISMDEKKITLPKFAGKHTKFVYDSDDEIVEVFEEETAQSEDSAVGASAPSILRLNGLPTPKGKHLRFLEE